MVEEIAAAATALSTALQFAEATSLNNDYKVTCHMEIHNLTRFTLKTPYVAADGGTVVEPPTDIAPGQRGKMVTRKTDMSAYGSFGSVCWELAGNTFALMWNAPFELVFQNNSLAVGIKSSGGTKDLHHTMSTTTADWFSRQEFGDRAGTLVYQNDDFQIHANMGATHHTIIRVAVYPLKAEDIAQPIRAEMRRQAQEKKH